jgi:hypothetical protein
MNSFVEGTVTVALAIVGLGMLSVLVSRKANTAGVLQAGGSAFSNALAVASAPVSGTELHLSLGYPGGSSLGSAFGS